MLKLNSQFSNKQKIQVKKYDLNELKLFIEKSLTSRFLNFSDALKRSKVVEKHDRFIMSCPYCGDSSSSDKKRGNFYFHNQHYICYNGGCDASESASSFVKFLHKFCNNSEPSYSLEDVSFTLRNKPTISFKKDIFNEYFPTFDEWCESNYIRNPTQKDLEYLQSRLLSSNNIYSNKQGIIIPNLLPIDNEVYVLSQQVRKRELSEFRYYTKDFIKKTDIPEFNILSRIYNIGIINHNIPVPVTEGYFDSTLLNNSISCSGIKNTKKILDFLDIHFDIEFDLFLDNDKDGMFVTSKIVNNNRDKKINFFLWKKFLKDNNLIKIKDINEIILKKHKPLFMKNIDRNKYISNKKLDLFFAFEL